MFGKHTTALKTIPLDQKVTVELQLSKIGINYNARFVESYWADIEYSIDPSKSRNEDNPGQGIRVKADSWEKLIDKVMAHFKEES